MNNKYLDKIAESQSNHSRKKKLLMGGAFGAIAGAQGYEVGSTAKNLYNDIIKKKPYSRLNEGTRKAGRIGGLIGLAAGAYGGYTGFDRADKRKAKKYEEESKNQEKAAQVLEKLAKAPTIKKSHKGLLHKKLGIPEDQEIPLSKLRAAKAKAKKNGDKKLEQEATFAINAKTKWD